MRKAISLFLVFSILSLSGGLFANKQKYEFSLVKKYTELAKEKLEFVTLKRDLLSPYDQTLLIKPPQHKQMNLNFSRNENFWKGAKIGAFIGGLAMLVFALASSDESESSRDPGYIDLDFSWLNKVLFIGGGVVLGGLIGGAIATQF